MSAFRSAVSAKLRNAKTAQELGETVSQLIVRIEDAERLVADLPRHRCEPCEPDPHGWMIDRDAAIAVLRDLAR